MPPEMAKEESKRPFRLVFFGLPLAALLLARDGHDVALVSLSRTDSVGLRRARRIFGPDRLLLKPSAREPALLERVRALEPDLLVSWFWTTRLPMTLVRAARLGGIGAHPSLLPRHRGPDPTYWALACGDEETGVSVHRIEAEYDTGAVLAQERLRIDPTWNAWLLARALDRPSLRLLRATVARLARGEEIADLAQDPALATQAPLPDDAACALRWTWTTARILRQIRALSPAPGAWTEIEGALVTVLEAEETASFPGALRPGEGVADGDRVLVRTADGAIELRRGEIDGVPAGPAELATLFLGRVGGPP